VADLISPSDLADFVPLMPIPDDVVEKVGDIPPLVYVRRSAIIGVVDLGESCHVRFGAGIFTVQNQFAALAKALVGDDNLFFHSTVDLDDGETRNVLLNRQQVVGLVQLHDGVRVVTAAGLYDLHDDIRLIIQAANGLAS
jgi:hypothetical protein